MTRRLLISLAVVLSISVYPLTGCSRNAASAVALGETCYEIPDARLFSSPLSALFEGLPLDDASSSVHLRFPAAYVAEHVAGYSAQVDGHYGKYADDLTAIVSALSRENLDYIQAGTHWADLWRATGSYSKDRLGQRVEIDPEVGLYRVYHDKIANGWKYVDMDPLSLAPGQAPHGNHVIASCHYLAGDQGRISCQHSRVFGDLHLEYSTPGENFPLYTKIDDFVIAELANWNSGARSTTRCGAPSE